MRIAAGPFPRRTVALGVLLLIVLPSAVWAWAGTQHVQIGRAAGRNVPDEMAAFRAFSRPMAFPSIYPDLWKGSDAAEGRRHYFEADRLPADTDFLLISPSEDEAFDRFKLRRDFVGTAPWTVADLVARMSDAMRTNDWMWAARCGAALSHYVADLHMPLHCTRNFNGQESWQHGIHTRWESEMTKAFFKRHMINPQPAVYIEDPFRETMNWASHSLALSREVLKADVIAKRAAGGRVDTETYFRKLWDLTGDMVIRQISDATTDLSSLWYTAWVDAGKPPVPAPFAELPAQSVHSGVGIDPLADGGVQGSPPRQKKTYDVIIWSVMGGLALLIIGSSIWRGIQAKKPSGK